MTISDQPTLTSSQPPPPAHAGPPTTSRSAGWVVCIVIGSILLVTSMVLLATGAVLQVLDVGSRQGGYVTSDEIRLNAPSHAIVTEPLDSEELTVGASEQIDLLTNVRLRASDASGEAIFVGIARADQAATYLAGIGHATLTDVDDWTADYVQHPGAAPTRRPAEEDIWVAQASGSGTQSLDWTVTPGRWVAVIMNADGSSGIAATVDMAAPLPDSGPAARLALIACLGTGLAGTVLTILGIRGIRRRPTGPR